MPIAPRPRRAAAALAALALVAPLSVAQARQQPDHAAHGASPPAAPADTGGGFGAIVFETSAAPAAQAAFRRGVLLLHNFHYPDAVAAFRRARALDSLDVMSAAFEALAHTHPVWNEQDTTLARAALRRLAPTPEARAARARTPRERGWLEAVEALYAGDTPKAVRDTAFSRAMARLRAADPRDPEAASIHALSLLGLNQGEREPVAYAAAEAIADSVLRAHPRHPGALHYLIHAVDDPANAGRGLDAARAYADVAPMAGHAQHMTSHIFVALGMWDEVVRANERAQALAGPVFGHATHWLAYGLVQQGRPAAAQAWVDSMLALQRGVASGARRTRSRQHVELHALVMSATQLMDAEMWDAPLARLSLDSAFLPSPSLVTGADFLIGYAAARRAMRPLDLTPGSRAADRALADSMLARMTSRHARLRAVGDRSTALGEAEVMEAVLRAELLAVAGRADSAIALLRAAGARLEALPFAFGPPIVAKPPRERAAELLVIAARPAEALAELELVDRLAPGRAAARLARARALVALGRRDEVARAYATLADQWRSAEPGHAWRDEALAGAGRLDLASGMAEATADTVSYASDSLQLRGTLWRTPAVRDGARHPAVVLLHGSGACWWRQDVETLGRLFAARGYVTFMPCRRGLGLSAGQGVTSTAQTQAEGLPRQSAAQGARATELLTTVELDDVRAAIAALRARPEVDPARVAVAGTSYGGILTLLAAEDDSTLRAAVSFAPAAMNWGWNAPLRARLEQAARRTRVPTLFVQAENDWSLEPHRALSAAMRTGGGDAYALLYPALGGHAVTGHALMPLAPTLWFDDVAGFLDRHVAARR